jgi:hypothetical protein
MRRSFDASGIGQKDGTSATAGRKARTIQAVLFGKTFSKRVFFDQKYILVSSKLGHDIVTAWSSEDEAILHRDAGIRDGYTCAYAVAETVRKEK